jgi:Ca2+/Na+ antiporter
MTNKFKKIFFSHKQQINFVDAFVIFLFSMYFSQGSFLKFMLMTLMYFGFLHFSYKWHNKQVDKFQNDANTNIQV